MNKRIKARWVKALRSGKYKQGDGKLRTADNRFCCLGVLCDVHAKSTGKKWRPSRDSMFPWKYINAGTTLPTSVTKWAGLKDCDPEVLGNPLSCHNDGYNTGKKTFRGIATLIEKHL